MNGTNTKNIGIYDADRNQRVLINGQLIKRKGQKAPSETIHQGDITIFFGTDFKSTAICQDQLCISFIDASKNGTTELHGVGFGNEVISVEVL